jgi:hypothetical protein
MLARVAVAVLVDTEQQQELAEADRLQNLRCNF